MIAYLKGTLAVKTPTEAILDVQGVGYRVFISLQTYERLPATGETVHLITHYIIREDGHFLYGFLDPVDYDLFSKLIAVNGVGPRIAISILSAVKVSDFIQHIALANVRLLKTIPGVGQKMAERLIVELKDKVSKLQGTSSADWMKSGTSRNQDDAIAALVALGFNRSTAEKTIAGLVNSSTDSLQTDELVRLALRQTVK